MRRVIVHWNRDAILSSDLAPMLDICRSMEILANLAVHADGVTHLMRIEFEEGYGPEALDEIGFLNVIRVDDLGGGIHHIEVVDKHTVALAIAEMDGVAVIPPLRFDRSGFTINLQGSRDVLKDFIDLIRLTHPPDRISVVAEHDEGTDLLTDRQREALTLAVRHGFYEHPKAIKLQELADLMNISRSTFQGHLALAEATLARWYVGRIEEDGL